MKDLPERNSLNSVPEAFIEANTLVYAIAQCRVSTMPSQYPRKLACESRPISAMVEVVIEPVQPVLAKRRKTSKIPPTGLEPVACSLGNCRSIHLSYEGNYQTILMLFCGFAKQR